MSEKMSPNQKTDLFLDLWRQLESAAERQLRGNSSSGGSAVMRLARDKRFSGYREQLDACREVRNLLSHQAKVNGQYPVHPSDAMISMLRQVLQRIEDPPRVQDVMTPVEQLLTAEPHSPVLPIMREMRGRGLSHVPLLQNGRVKGVFSVETVFQAMLDGAASIGEEVTMQEYADYLPLAAHMSYSFGFIRRSLPLAEAEAMFEKGRSRERKLKLLLVTSDGTDAKPLLGVITPYDLMGRE